MDVYKASGCDANCRFVLAVVSIGVNNNQYTDIQCPGSKTAEYSYPAL